MELEIYWHKPVSLIPGQKSQYRTAQHFTYAVAKDLPQSPGVYMFGRFFGESFAPLYIGQAGNIENRVWEHFKGNVALMNRIKHDSKIGRRVLIAGEFYAKPGQRWQKCVSIVEDALIRRALAEGHVLFNKSGTAIRTHRIRRDGYGCAGFVPTVFEIER